MKIAFIGTHGTGKTTLTHELVANMKKNHLDADFLGEIVRKCPFPINEDTTKKSQIWIILKQILEEMEAEEKSDILVCDRSVLDPYIYYVNKFGRNKVIEALVLQHLKTYKYLIKVPIRTGFLKADKIRSVDENFQKKIDSLMNKFLKSFNIKYLELNRVYKGGFIQLKDGRLSKSNSI